MITYTQGVHETERRTKQRKERKERRHGNFRAVVIAYTVKSLKWFEEI